LSEEQLYGHEATEAAAGLYPIPEPSPADTGAGKDVVGSDVASLREAADELPRPAESQPDVIDYYRSEDGSKYSEFGTVTLERAAEDLTELRRQRGLAQEASDQDAIRRHVDAIRSGQIPHPPPQQHEAIRAGQQQHAQTQPGLVQHSAPAQPAATNAPTPEEVKAYGVQAAQWAQSLRQEYEKLSEQIAEAASFDLDYSSCTARQAEIAAQVEQANYIQRVAAGVGAGGDVELAMQLAHPKVMQAIVTHLGTMTQNYQADLARHAAGAQTSAIIANAALLDGFPELQNVSLDRLPGVIAGIRSQNPERATQIEAHFNHLNNLQRTATAVRAQVAAVGQAQFQHWANQQDAIFQKRNPEFGNPNYVRTMTPELAQYISESLDMTPQELAFAYHTKPEVRSYRSQEMLYKAFLYDQSKKNGKYKRANPVPQVQRPGSPMDRAPRGKDLPTLPRRFESGQRGLRQAAEYLTQRRAAR